MERPNKKAKVDGVDESRYFTNSWSNKTDSTNTYEEIFSDDLKKLISSRFQNYLDLVDKHYEKKKTSDFSVYTGLAGISLMYFHLYQQEDSSQKKHYLDKALYYVEHALSTMKRYGDPQITTFLEGNGGPLALASVLYHLAEHNEKSEEFISQLKNLKQNALKHKSDELLYGRAGYLYSLLFVQKHANKHEDKALTEIIKMVADKITESGRNMSKYYKGNMMFEWHKESYLGAAHGLAGILCMLVKVPTVTCDTKLMKELKSSIHDYIQQMVLPSGNYKSTADDRRDNKVHWCHGATGITLAFLRYHQVFQDESYLKAAITASDVVWKRGLLKKGLGLCHGVAGNAYVFLKLYESTKDVTHLERAICYAQFCCEKEELIQVPDTPFSLFEGLAGTVCFLHDILHKQYNFPAFDV